MLTPKFLRAHAIPNGVNGFAWYMKLMYEFWGFCVNGGNDLKIPGGFAPVSGVIAMPWLANDVGCLVSGSDGYTDVGMPFFNTSAPVFSASYVNKWLVTWKSGSESSDDSIYLIKQWINSSSIRVNTLNGATPYTGTLQPTFEQRSGINYRVMDFAPPAAMGLTGNSSALIIQFNAAADVNPGQSLSQVRLRYSTAPSGYAGYAYGIGFTISPSGSWNGTQFVSESIPEFYPGSGNSGYWFNGSDNPGYLTFMGSRDFFITHYKAGQSEASGFHIEIPQRLYPQGVDPNPVALMGFGVYDVTTTDGNNHYGGGFYMHNPPDNSLQRYNGMSRRYSGNSEQSAPGFYSNGRFNGAYFNTYQNKFLLADIVLAQGFTSGQFQMARARLRRVRVMPPIIPSFERVGNNGEWIHIRGGVLWPWDNALLPYNLFLGGF